MYRNIIRPLLFLLQPEAIHHLVSVLVKISFKIPGVSPLVRSLTNYKSDKLETEFLGMKFRNPVGLAAGFDKNAELYNPFFDLGFSHIEVGTVTPKGQAGNPKPRSFRIKKDRGLINRMGFNNKGLDLAAKNLRKKRRKGLIIGGNIGKNTATANADAVADYEACFRGLYDHVDYFVVNVSCPNVTNLCELQDQDGLEGILGRLAELRKEESTYKPILLKISPDLNEGQIDSSIAIVKKYGIDGMVATNTTVSRANLKTSKEEIERIANGGMSGAPITQRSLEVVKYISKKTDGTMPIIGVGGIMSVQDALNMLDAGASLIQVYSGFIYEGVGFMRRINRGVAGSH